jgi:hypothetical protein
MRRCMAESGQRPDAEGRLGVQGTALSKADCSWAKSTVRLSDQAQPPGRSWMAAKRLSAGRHPSLSRTASLANGNPPVKGCYRSIHGLGPRVDRRVTGRCPRSGGVPVVCGPGSSMGWGSARVERRAPSALLVSAKAGECRLGSVQRRSAVLFGALTNSYGALTIVFVSTIMWPSGCPVPGGGVDDPQGAGTHSIVLDACPPDRLEVWPLCQRGRTKRPALSFHRRPSCRVLHWRTRSSL